MGQSIADIVVAIADIVVTGADIVVTGADIVVVLADVVVAVADVVVVAFADIVVAMHTGQRFKSDVIVRLPGWQVNVSLFLVLSSYLVMILQLFICVSKVPWDHFYSLSSCSFFVNFGLMLDIKT